MIISNDIDKPVPLTETVAEFVIDIVANADTMIENDPDIVSTINYDKYGILIIDALIFNIYSKIRNSDINLLNSSMYSSSQASMSLQSTELSVTSIEKQKFKAFIREIINNDDIFDGLQRMIEVRMDEQLKKDAIRQVIKISCIFYFPKGGLSD